MPPTRRPSRAVAGPTPASAGVYKGSISQSGLSPKPRLLPRTRRGPTSAARCLYVLDNLGNWHVQCLGEIVQPLEQQATPPFFHANEQRSIDIRRQSECFLRQSALYTEVSNAAPHPLAGGRPGLGALRIVLAGSSGHRKELRRADTLSL